MKTLALYILVLGAGLVTALTSSSTEENTSHYAQLPTITLGTPSEISTASIEVEPIDHANKSPRYKKQYHIYYENRSTEAIEVAIRYKAYNGEWNTTGLLTLSPGEKKLMGLSDQKTYYSYAETKRRWKKKTWRGAHKFPLTEDSANKKAFKKQEIWECYDSRMCNTFAVFK
ncbi:hypothetical protein [Roseivirga pacifica]